jgi:hypothetical protein
MGLRSTVTALNALNRGFARSHGRELRATFGNTSQSRPTRLLAGLALYLACRGNEPAEWRSYLPLAQNLRSLGDVGHPLWAKQRGAGELDNEQLACVKQIWNLVKETRYVDAPGGFTDEAPFNERDFGIKDPLKHLFGDDFSDPGTSTTGPVF